MTLQESSIRHNSISLTVGTPRRDADFEIACGKPLLYPIFSPDWRASSAQAKVHTFLIPDCKVYGTMMITALIITVGSADSSG